MTLRPRLSSGIAVALSVSGPLTRRYYRMIGGPPSFQPLEPRIRSISVARRLAALPPLTVLRTASFSAGCVSCPMPIFSTRRRVSPSGQAIKTKTSGDRTITRRLRCTTSFAWQFSESSQNQGSVMCRGRAWTRSKEWSSGWPCFGRLA